MERLVREGPFWAAVLALAALAAWVRWDGAGAQPLWYDEICSVIRADGRFDYAVVPFGEVVPKIPVEIGPVGPLSKAVDAKGDNHPPLYFVLLRLWKDALGDDPATLRHLSALASLAGVGLGALLAGLWAGRRGALSALLLLGLSPFDVFYAREARPYALMGALSLGALLALARLEADGRREEGAQGLSPTRRGALWLGYAVGVAGTLASSYTALAAPLAHAGYALLRRASSLARLPHALAVAGLLLTPIAGVTAKHLWFTFNAPTGALSFAKGAQGENDLRLGARADAPASAARLVLGLAAGPRAGAVALYVGGGVVILLALRGASREARMAGAAAVAMPALLLAIDLATAGNRSAIVRYGAISAGPLLVAASVGLASLAPRVALPLAALIVATFATTIAADRSAPAKDSDLRGAARLLDAAGCDKGDLVVLLLQFREQVIELNPHITGSPDQLLVLDRVDPDVISSLRWRSVYLVAIPARRKAADQLRAGIGGLLPERETHDVGGIVVARFSRGP